MKKKILYGMFALVSMFTLASCAPKGSTELDPTPVVDDVETKEGEYISSGNNPIFDLFLEAREKSADINNLSATSSTEITIDIDDEPIVVGLYQDINRIEREDNKLEYSAIIRQNVGEEEIFESQVYKDGVFYVTSYDGGGTKQKVDISASDTGAQEELFFDESDIIEENISEEDDNRVLSFVLNTDPGTMILESLLSMMQYAVGGEPVALGSVNSVTMSAIINEDNIMESSNITIKFELLRGDEIISAILVSDTTQEIGTAVIEIPENADDFELVE